MLGIGSSSSSPPPVLTAKIASIRSWQIGTTTSVPLGRTGTLWTWTRQRFQPKNPPYIGREPAGEFEPYGVGFIELPEGRIEARLAGDIDQELRIGMPMELTVVPFATDEDGTEVLTFAFRPIES